MKASEIDPGFWSDYPQGVDFLLYSLRHIRNHAEGFPHPEDPRRLSVSPASLCALRNGLEVYATRDQRYLRFKDHINAQCETRHTEPASFGAPIYDELMALLEHEACSNRTAEHDRTSERHEPSV